MDLLSTRIATYYTHDDCPAGRSAVFICFCLFFATELTGLHLRVPFSSVCLFFFVSDSSSVSPELRACIRRNYWPLLQASLCFQTFPNFISFSNLFFLFGMSFPKKDFCTAPDSKIRLNFVKQFCIFAISFSKIRLFFAIMVQHSPIFMKVCRNFSNYLYAKEQQ